MHYIKHKELAEEIVSDVFVNLWTKRKSLSHIKNIETYLFVSVKNASLNHIKQTSAHRPVCIEEGIEPTTIEDPEKELEKRELISKMEEAIKSLPPQCRIIFCLIKEDGLRYKQVADILNLSPRTIETQLVRAIKKLDNLLSPYISRSRQRYPETRTRALSLIKSILFSIIFFLLCK